MYIDKEKTKSRTYYYDAVKALSIYLVCLYHYNNLNYNILESQDIEVYANYYFYGIPSMAVPLFFMVNGALLLNKPYRLENHLRKVVYLYVLFLAWSAISLIVFIPIEGNSYSLEGFLRSWLSLDQGISNHLWFLQALIAIYLLFPFLKVIYDLPQRKLLNLFCLIVFAFSFGNLFLNSLVNAVEFVLGLNYLKGDSFNLFSTMNPFGSYCYAFFYFTLGGIISNKIACKKIRISTKALPVIFSIALLMLFLYGTLMTKSDNAFYDTVWNGYSSLMTLAMSISAFLLFSRLNYNNEIVNRCLILIGSNTLGIYLVHRFVGAITIAYFNNLISLRSLPLNLLYGCLLILGSLAIVLLLKKLPLVKKTLSF